MGEFLFDLDVKTESHIFSIASIVTKSKQITSAYEEIRTSGNLEVSQTHLAISSTTTSIVQWQLMTSLIFVELGKY